MEGFLMITKHKTSIALVACLLLAQSHVMHGKNGTADPATNLVETTMVGTVGAVADAFKELAIAMYAVIGGGAIGGYLLYDAVVDHAATLKWQGIQRERESYVKSALDIAQDLQLKVTQKEAQKKAEDKFPGSGRVPTPVWKRMLKGSIATGLLAVAAWRAHRFYSVI